MIVVNNISKQFIVKTGSMLHRRKKNVNAVKGVSINIPQGKIVGLLGINGAGKTTIIKMISTMLQPSSGSIIIDGIDTRYNQKEARGKIGLITGTERSLYWNLTGRENLQYFGRLYGLKNKELSTRIKDLINIVGLEDKEDILVEKYSKGMKQRLHIARGLLHNPKYIFLDEPTLGLDVSIAKEVRQYVANLAAKQNKGVLLTTHYMREVEELCDYIYVINNGKVVIEGTLDDIKKHNNKYSQVRVIVGEIEEKKLSDIRREMKKNKNNEFIDVTHNPKNGEIIIRSKTKNLTEIMNVLVSNQISVSLIEEIVPSIETILLNISEEYKGE